MPPLRFVLLSHARTGSTLLHTLLAAHPEVRIFGELFNPNENLRRNFLGNIPFLENQADPVAYLKNHIYKNNHQAVGFKLFYYHARSDNWAAVWEFLKSEKIAILHLRRKNLLERFLSQKSAESTGIWIQKSGAKPAAKPCLELDLEECIRDMYRTEHFELQSREFFWGNPYLEIYYEDLVDPYSTALTNILAFLRVSLQPLPATTEKQAILPKSKRIKNYTKLKEGFRTAIDEKWAKPHWLGFLEDKPLPALNLSKT